MGRHADPTAPRRPALLLPLVAAAVVVLLVAGGLVWWLTGSGGASGACDTRQPVAVTVAPELGELAEDLLADPVELDGGACAVAEVTTQEPLQTVGGLAALEAGALPDVWVPDSSLWVARAGDAPVEPVGSLASSPVVLATSSAVADELGWTGSAPSWGAALSTGRPLAVPDLAGSAEGLSALAAVRQSLGGGEEADNVVVEAVLAAARAEVITPADGLAAGASGAEDAPLVPVSEQEVYATNRGADGSGLVAVYPTEGSPSLDYPVVRIGSASGNRAAAAEAVVRALTSEAARTAARDAGFRDSDGTAPRDAAGAGIQEAAPAALALDPAGVQGLLARLSSLAAPSRILAVFDVSTSMEAPVGDGTRATLARDAAKSTLSLVPGDFALGLWVFAYRLDGDQDFAELLPIRELDADVDGRPQRDVLAEQLDTIPGRLTPGGTGLYDTTLAAVRAAREDYDPTAVNSVLVLTDGTNEDDSNGVALDSLLQTLRSEANPERPVKVIGVALGPDADLQALQQIAEATDGAAYSAVDPADLQTVLFDALRQRG